MMKKAAYLGLIVITLVAGCASKSLDIPNLERSSTFVVEDLRPDSEKVDKTFSLLIGTKSYGCLLYTSPSPRDGLLSRMPSSA